VAYINHPVLTATADPIINPRPDGKCQPQKIADIRTGDTSTGATKGFDNLVPAFVARGISKIYQMGEVQVHALTSVDLELYDGELVVLLGASGSGKSTLLNILGGLDVPTSGEVFYRDHNLTIDDDAELTRYRREHVGFVFQFYNLIPSLTALENVELVTDIAENPMRPEEALQLVGLGDRMHHFPA
jgi:putative ABC transport system ATP-binding protein